MPSPLSPSVVALRCLRCGAAYPADARAYLCAACGSGDGDPGVLDVVYDYAAAAADVFPGAPAPRADVFRWRALLPVDRPDAPLLAAGGTPLIAAPRLAARLGLAALWL
ncbi:MAG TPA: hypothetical protein VHG91_20215, partial [Longimicrobium sp.]|nr:hypothetical protein [Longimicrobium sp.]